MQYEVLINAKIIHDLKSLQGKPYSEVLEILKRRYPIACDLIPDWFHTHLGKMSASWITSGYDPAFSEVFDCAFEFAMDVDLLDHNWYAGVMIESQLVIAENMYDQQLSFGMQAERIPSAASPQRVVIPIIGSLYVQLCEGLARLVFAQVASLGSVLKGERRTIGETTQWSTRSLWEYVGSIGQGKYRKLLDHYDPIIRNACAHMRVTVSPWEPQVTFADGPSGRSMTSEDFCNYLYRFKQTLDQVIIGLQFYGFTHRYGAFRDSLKALPLEKAAKLLFEGARVDTLLTEPTSPLSAIELVKAELGLGGGLTVYVVGPPIRAGQERDWVIRVAVRVWRKVVSILVEYLGHSIRSQSVRVEERKGRILGKHIASVTALQTTDRRLIPAESPIYIPGPRKRRS